MLSNSPCCPQLAIPFFLRRKLSRCAEKPCYECHNRYFFTKCFFCVQNLSNPLSGRHSSQPGFELEILTCRSTASGKIEERNNIDFLLYLEEAVTTSVLPAVTHSHNVARGSRVRWRQMRDAVFGHPVGNTRVPIVQMVEKWSASKRTTRR